MKPLDNSEENSLDISGEDSSSSNEVSIEIHNINENTSEIERINCDYRKIKTDIFGKLMEFKSYSRNIINSDNLQEEEKKIRLDTKYSTDKENCSKRFETLKNLNDVLKLYKELHIANCELTQAKDEVLSSNYEYVELHEKIKDLESTISEKMHSRSKNCTCNCVLM